MFVKAGRLDLQDRKHTISPKEYPAVSTPSLPTMLPQARSNRQMSRKKRSRNKTQEDLTAAIVKSTVTINHAHKYIASAWLNSGLIAPVEESVYAAMIPDPGK
jgi:hypothetical protein